MLMYQQNRYQAWSKSRMLMYQQTPEAKSRTPVENVDVSTKSALGFIPKMTSGCYFRLLLMHQHSLFLWSLNLILLIHQHFPLAFFLLPQVFVDTSTLPILVELELDFVDTSTFSTGFLPVASGFCWYINTPYFGGAWTWFCWYINIFHWLSSCCLRFLLIHQHSLFWWSLNLILLIHQHFPLTFFLLPQVFVDTSTLPILVELELDCVDTSTFSAGFLPVASGFCWYINTPYFGGAWTWFCWYINIFHWLSSCCLRFLLIRQHSLFWWSLNLILLIHQHFPLAFFLLPQVFVDTSTLPILVELELDFVDTSTFSTGFLPVASGFCWYINTPYFGGAWTWFCWYINIFHWLSSCCLRFLLIHQHSLFWWSLNLILLIHQHFPLAFFLLPQIFVVTPTLPILVDLEVDLSDTLTISWCCFWFLLK